MRCCPLSTCLQRTADYEEEDGFKEIDNSLKLKTSETGEKYFENTANSFKVKLFEKLDKRKNVSIENKGYTLEFSLRDRIGEIQQLAKADVMGTEFNNAITKANKVANTDAVDYSNKKLKEPLQPNVGEAGLVYRNVFQNVDFEYSITSSGVKEDIIVHSTLEHYEFHYTITAPDLSLLLTNEGEIIAYTETEEAVFVIPAPNMTDAAGVYSEEVSYTLTDREDGTYILGIMANENWMNAPERAFPVKIDPAVYSITKETANGLTLYYSGGKEYNQPRIKFGKVDSKTCDSFISFPNENDQFYLSGYQLTYSKLRYYVRSVGNSTVGSTDYYVRTAKSTLPLGNVTAFSQMEYTGSPILLSNTIKSYKSWFTTKHEERWEEAYFNPEAFNGCADMVFMWYYTTTNDNQHGEVDVREGNLPSVLNYYVSTVGVKEDLPYEQFEYNGGAANINLINGAVTASFSALSIDVPTNPIALELVYNDYYDEIMTEFGMHKMFGNNIKINFQQGIKRETKAVRYVDADGSIDTLGQEGGAYYSVNRNMTYNINANALFIGGKTKLLFDGNKSYRYYDASFIHKEKLMYEIFYSGSKITQIAGYTEGVKTHYISFTYSGDRVIYAQSYMAEDVISGYPFQLLARCDFSYDADGNLTQIKNYNSNSVKFKFEYNEGQLYGLTDFDGNGYLFGRAHWTNPSPMRMSIINYIYGNSPAYDDYYRYDYVSFSADAKVSNVTYYDADGNKLGERSVSRRFAKGVQSGWYKDDKGETAISTVSSSMTGDGNREYLTYTQNIYSTIQKQNTTLSASSYSINPGSSLSGSISTNHGIVSKSGRQYCISLFLYSYGTTFAEILVNGTSRGKISLNGATKSYFIIPVSYYSGATSIQIKNTGNNYLDVSDVSYNYYTSTQIKKRIETMSVFNYVNFVENRGLDYRQTVRYDFLGQITSASETDYSGTTATTKNYTYTYEEYPNITTRSEYDAKRIKSISDGTKEITYEYSSSGVLNNKITTITKDGGTNISKTVSETNGALGEYFTIQTKNGITVRTDYGIKGGNVQPYKITSGNSVIEYEYNYNGQITKVKENGKLVQQTNYSNGKESSFNLGSTESYALVRDSLNFGLVTGINHNGSRKLTIDYNDNGDVNLTTYANGATIEYTYDYRELQSVELKDSPSAVATNIAYGYTGKDLTSVTQSRNGVTQLAYQFTDSKTQAKMTVSGDLNASYTYNYDEETGWLTNRTINLENSKTRTEWFTFDGHGVLQSQGNIDHKTLYGYDSLDRLSTKTQVVGSIERQKLQYNYISTTEYQTNRISSIYNITNSSRQTYSYNNRGYISSYNNTLNGDSYSYIYDGAGRLTSDGKYTYAYDTLNNITSKTSSGSTTEYGYWSGSKTRLQYISENGIKRYFSYDTMGNITNYKGSSTTSSQNLYWTRGNMLSHGNIQSGKNFSYQYGADNLRYSKTVNGEETLYYWDGDVLVGEKTGANYTQYLYDASGIIGMIYNGAYYYFEKNLFGDVLKAYNVSGTSVASFQYDSYGNVLSKSGSMWDKVHFRYRGYYYDEETSFYYLQSRYYDPSICRFISADQYELIGALSKSLGELNLYSYCANNPIIYTDGSGQSIIFWLILGSIVASGLITGFSAMNNSIEGESKLGAFIGGFVDGAVGAASLAAGIATGGIGGFFVTIGGSFIGGFTGNVINQLISYGNVDPKISAAQGFFSALTNGVIYVGFSFIGLVEGATWGMRFIDAVKLSPISLAFSAYFMYYAFPNVNKIRER